MHVTVNEPISTSFLLFDAFSTAPSIAEPGRRQIAIYDEFSSFLHAARGTAGAAPAPGPVYGVVSPFMATGRGYSGIGIVSTDVSMV